MTTSIETMNVIKRCSFVSRISELTSLSTDLQKACMSHLILRRMLRIGDSGLHNILLINQKDESARSQLIAGIDMEEFNSATGNSKENWNCLTGLINKH